MHLYEMQRFLIHFGKADIDALRSIRRFGLIVLKNSKI